MKGGEKRTLFPPAQSVKKPSAGVSPPKWRNKFNRFFQGHAPWKNTSREASVDEGGAERSEIPLKRDAAASLLNLSDPRRLIWRRGSYRGDAPPRGISPARSRLDHQTTDRPRTGRRVPPEWGRNGFLPVSYHIRAHSAIGNFRYFQFLDGHPWKTMLASAGNDASHSRSAAATSSSHWSTSSLVTYPSSTKASMVLVMEGARNTSLLWL